MVGNEDSHFGVAVKSLRGPLFPKKKYFHLSEWKREVVSKCTCRSRKCCKRYVCRERGKSMRSMRIVHSLMMKILMFCY